MKKKIEELDFKLVFKILWDYRKTIIISIFCFSFFGVIISFTTPFEYTAQTTVILVESSSGSSNISQLASLAGFDLMSGLGDDQSISPNLYPTVVYSSPFLKELSDFKIKVEGFDNRILLKDYLYNYSQLSKIDIFKKDILMVFSVGGGNLKKKVSVNLIKAIKYANLKKGKIISVIGRSDGYAYRNSTVSILVNVEETKLVTPISETFQALLWHFFVSHPYLQVNKTKW